MKRISFLSTIIFLLTLVIVFLVYSHTLNYPWKHFDDQIIYNETIYPIARSLPEVFEYIKHFGLFHYFEASNPFYSSISNLRCDPFNTLITLFVFYFFQKNSFCYHALSLILHLLNTGLLFLLLNRISAIETRLVASLQGNILRIILISVLTLIWALHPVNVESILLTTNWAAIFGYFLCLIVFLFYTNYLLKNRDMPWHVSTVLFFIYLITVFNTEYSITLPIILFAYTYSIHTFFNKNTTLIRALTYSLKNVFPLLLATFVFILFFIVKNNLQLLNEDKLITFQRIFWLSPQLLFHNLKLIFFPVNLSIDQTSMVNLSRTYFGLHSISSIIITYIILLFLLVSLILVRKNFFFYSFTCICPFLIALFPFLHIVSPTYCLSSERYLYFPSFIFVFGIAHLIFSMFSQSSSQRDVVHYVSTMIVLVSILIFLGTKTYSRTHDWKDSATLFTSSANTTPTNLFKALRIAMLGSLYSGKNNIQANLYLNSATKLLQEYLKKQESIKQKHMDSFPLVLKLYGLDPETLQAKAIYLLTAIKLGFGEDQLEAYQILRQLVEEKKNYDTQILDLYLTTSLSSNNFFETEDLLKEAYKIKKSPTILLALSTLYEKKYNDLNLSLKYLSESFKYFPYDIQTLYSLKATYQKLGNIQKHAFFSYLYGLRVHDLESLKESYNKKEAKKIEAILQS